MKAESWLLAAVLGLPTVASAAPRCMIPNRLETPHAEGPSASQPARVTPITGYTLALIWEPQHCSHTIGGAEALQCRGAQARSFVLHGLWPDGPPGTWPQWCAATAILPPRTIAAHYCATPSPQLLQHEWAKHGTCMPGMTPDRYFDLSNRLFRRLRFPDMAKLAAAPISERAFAQAFAGANRGITPDRIRLNLDRDGWLQEVWLCLDPQFRMTRCVAPDRADRTVRIRMPA